MNLQMMDIQAVSSKENATAKNNSESILVHASACMCPSTSVVYV